jgi:hypothetical protein
MTRAQVWGLGGAALLVTGALAMESPWTMFLGGIILLIAAMREL